MWRNTVASKGIYDLQIRRWVRYTHSHAFSDTLLLPKTDFGKKLGSEELEESFLQTDRLYHKQWTKYKELKSEEKIDRSSLFILHDGPPYANGNLHLGHAMNKILKDIILRYQLTIKGKYIFYQPGWDCHGLPIELKALEKVKHPDKLRDDPLLVRSLAKDLAKQTKSLQSNQFKEFNILTDWEKPYDTLNDMYQLFQLKFFSRLCSNGFISRQFKPVYWGIQHKTALAESELEYNDNHISKSIMVKFKLTQRSLDKLFKLSSNLSELITNVNLLIWTTTPWTIFANKAICINQNFQYCIINCKDEYLIVSRDNLSTLPSQDYKIICDLNGKDLLNLQYTNLLNETSPILHGDHVSNKSGTGLVHTAPGHGHDDYTIGLKQNLDIFSIVDESGEYDLNKFQHCSNPRIINLLTDSNTHRGKNVLLSQTTDDILNYLKNINSLFHSMNYRHSYPYDWRSKKPILIRSTPQWFITLSKIKPRAMESIQNVSFIPKRGFNRLNSFINSRNEWCISRQRVWGVPIPFFINKLNPESILFNTEILNFVINRMSKIGIDSWFNPKDDVRDWLPEDYKHLSQDYNKSQETMDVWFDSGVSWNTLLPLHDDKIFKGDDKRQGSDFKYITLADLYLEGSDQHRGWFQSSLLTYISLQDDCGVKPVAPFKQIVTHGFMLDSKGFKMSKSLGNVISPLQIINGDTSLKIPKLGIDGLRYFIAQNDYTNDISVSPVTLNHVRDYLKKITITLKFILGNLTKSETFRLLPCDSLRRMDKYTLVKLQELSEECKRYYMDYNFKQVLNLLQYHLNNELSSFYFNINKDVLYCDPRGSLKRQQIQTVLFHILNSYRAILQPIIPNLVQNSWKHVPVNWLNNAKEYQDNCMSLKYPDYRDMLSMGDKEIFQKCELVIRDHVQRQFSQLRARDDGITKTIQLKLEISREIPGVSLQDLEDILQLAEVQINDNIVQDETLNRVDLSDGPLHCKLSVNENKHACARCWKHTAESKDTLCSRCAQSI